MHQSQSQNCATVNFVNNLVFCFFPKYLGLLGLTKYFVKKMVVCVLRKASMFVILPKLWATFTPTIHDILQKKKAVPQRATVPVLTSGKEEKHLQSWYTHSCCQMGQTQDLHYL